MICFRLWLAVVFARVVTDSTFASELAERIPLHLHHRTRFKRERKKKPRSNSYATLSPGDGKNILPTQKAVWLMQLRSS
ncbi:MAG TPA: hypothetical protein VNW52_13330 [Burkholderiaceae bacterium]|nr:hypothetical protein [Burkholderiaceae bacterium]